MVALIGVMMTSWAEPAEKSDDSTTVYVNDSVSLLIMYSDLLAFIPISHTHTHMHTHTNTYTHTHMHTHTHKPLCFSNQQRGTRIFTAGL